MVQLNTSASVSNSYLVQSAPPQEVNSERLNSILLPLWEKVKAGERLSVEEGIALYQSEDLDGIAAMADFVRARRHGNIATYVFNRYINYSNHCILNCQFCAFSAKKRDPHAFEMSLPEIVATTREAWESGATEIHMVGGLHPTLPATWYLELLRAMRPACPEIKIKSFTAIEIRHLAARVFKKSIPETLTLLREAGLDALTGGGAEI